MPTPQPSFPRCRTALGEAAPLSKDTLVQAWLSYRTLRDTKFDAKDVVLRHAVSALATPSVELKEEILKRIEGVLTEGPALFPKLLPYLENLLTLLMPLLDSSDESSVTRIFRRIQVLGGTGYTSLTDLREVILDSIKLDPLSLPVLYDPINILILQNYAAENAITVGFDRELYDPEVGYGLATLTWIDHFQRSALPPKYGLELAPFERLRLATYLDPRIISVGTWIPNEYFLFSDQAPKKAMDIDNRRMSDVIREFYSPTRSDLIGHAAAQKLLNYVHYREVKEFIFTVLLREATLAADQFSGLAPLQRFAAGHARTEYAPTYGPRVDLIESLVFGLREVVDHGDLPKLMQLRAVLSADKNSKFTPLFTEMKNAVRYEKLGTVIHMAALRPLFSATNLLRTTPSGRTLLQFFQDPIFDENTANESGLRVLSGNPPVIFRGPTAQRNPEPTLAEEVRQAEGQEIRFAPR